MLRQGGLCGQAFSAFFGGTRIHKVFKKKQKVLLGVCCGGVPTPQEPRHSTQLEPAALSSSPLSPSTPPGRHTIWPWLGGTYLTEGLRGRQQASQGLTDQGICNACSRAVVGVWERQCASCVGVASGWCCFCCCHKRIRPRLPLPLGTGCPAQRALHVLKEAVVRM